MEQSLRLLEMMTTIPYLVLVLRAVSLLSLGTTCPGDPKYTEVFGRDVYLYQNAVQVLWWSLGMTDFLPDNTSSCRSSLFNGTPTLNTAPKCLILYTPPWCNLSLVRYRYTVRRQYVECSSESTPVPWLLVPEEKKGFQEAQYWALVAVIGQGGRWNIQK